MILWRNSNARKNLQTYMYMLMLYLTVIAQIYKKQNTYSDLRVFYICSRDTVSKNWKIEWLNTNLYSS